jgi:1-acyl-sn-glycerol-3-phosphate acyltransferase
MQIRKMLKRLFRFLIAKLTRLEVAGLENIPDRGGALLVTNHLSIIDPVLIFALIERHDITALVAKSHQKNPLYRWFVNRANGIWINRDEADTHAVRAARSFIQNGGIVGIAPEGTRSSTGSMLPAKVGAAYLAEKSKAMILPVAVTGTFKGIKKVFTFQRPKMTVEFGPLFQLPPVERHNRDIILHQNTDEMMCRIAVMLPPSYRGVYKDHPRLLELLAEKNSQNDQEMGERLPVENPSAS